MAKIYKSPVDMANSLNSKWSPFPKEGYNLTEKLEDYNDYYGGGEPITHSERKFNLALSNDQPVYEHFTKNLPALRERFKSGEDYQNILGELRDKGTWSKGEYDPLNIRKEYLQRILEDEEWNA